MKAKTVVQVRMIVTSAFGRIKTYPKKTIDKALEDAAKYDNGILGRTVKVEAREVIFGPWEVIE